MHSRDLASESTFLSVVIRYRALPLGLEWLTTNTVPPFKHFYP